ncbi:MAG: choice-of-anchor J domain-containing protein [Mediterranea sp.]|jgi:hypothetical protein|nr:choice-of-anchor J domain-containing protein [Mediterranea sp.]
MKKIVLLSALLLASLSACEDWNEDLNIQHQFTDVKEKTIALDNSAYPAIASLPANKELAQKTDPEGGSKVAVLEAIGTNKYFSSDADAELFLPAYIRSIYPNSTANSKFIVTYNLYQAPPAYLSEFANISTYEVSEADYKTVWGENIVASYLSPETIGQIPALLKAGVSGAAEGDMKVVNYAYSETEPSTGGTTPPAEVVYDPISAVLAAAGEYHVKGEVIATYQRGFLIKDETGSVLVYTNQVKPNVSVGDVVGVEGATSKYSGYMQFNAGAAITYLERKETFAYPAAATDISATLDAWAGSTPAMTYVKIVGTLTISGNYYNIEVEGATRKGSISYPAAGLVDVSLAGQKVELTGYAIGLTSSYVNVMATSLTAEGASPEFTPVGVVALAAPGPYKVKGTVVATYARGFLLNDGTGSVLVYLQAAEGFADGNYKVGDVVKVEGTTSAYGGLNQFPNSSKVEVVSTGSTYTQPAERNLTADDITAYIEAPYAAYVAYVGTLSASGNYYNVEVEGLTGIQGSLQYVGEALKASVDALNGKKILVKGYAIGTSGSSTKYLNTMTLSVEEASTAATRAFASTRAAVVPNASRLYRYDGSAWAAYTNDEVGVAVPDPTVYAELGATAITRPATVIPLYLASKFPLAADKSKKVVVYNGAAGYVAEEYILNKGVWAARPASATSIIIFEEGDADAFTRQPTTYLDVNFNGDDAQGFYFKDIKLPEASTYVWKLDSYGYMKASAYVGGINYASESYLVSPAIDLSTAIDPVLTFREAHRYLGGSETPDDRFGVYVSTAYEGGADSAINPADWTLLPATGWSDGTTWTFVTIGPLDLAAYTGQTIYLAFRYTSVDGSAATWEVDDVKVQERPAE